MIEFILSALIIAGYANWRVYIGTNPPGGTGFAMLAAFGHLFGFIPAVIASCLTIAGSVILLMFLTNNTDFGRIKNIGMNMSQVGVGILLLVGIFWTPSLISGLFFKIIEAFQIQYTTETLGFVSIFGNFVYFSATISALIFIIKGRKAIESL